MISLSREFVVGFNKIIDGVKGIEGVPT